MTDAKSELGFHVDYLNLKLQEIRARNIKFSLRAFARKLGVNVSTLSQILRGIEIPSVATSKKILDSLDATPDQRARFMESVFSKRAISSRESVKSFSFAIDLTNPAVADQIVSGFVARALESIPNTEKSNRHIVRIVLFPDTTSTKSHSSTKKTANDLDCQVRP